MWVAFCVLVLAAFAQALPGAFLASGNNNRIVGGDEALPHQFPYQVGLNLFLDNGMTSFCGGSLISEWYILTAAHCTQTVKKVEIILGAHRVDDHSEITQVRMNSSIIIVHEKWNPVMLINDIAVIKFPKRVKFNKYINAVPLPSKNDKKEFGGEDAIISGWGRDFDGSTTISPILRYVKTDVISVKQCQAKYPMVIHETHLCTSGDDGKSSCNGDSGGPLVVEENGTKVQIGLVSFGRKQCEKGYPAVFTRITSYLDWIEKNTDVELH